MALATAVTLTRPFWMRGAATRKELKNALPYVNHVLATCIQTMKTTLLKFSEVPSFDYQDKMSYSFHGNKMSLTPKDI